MSFSSIDYWVGMKERENQWDVVLASLGLNVFCYCKSPYPADMMT